MLVAGSPSRNSHSPACTRCRVARAAMASMGSFGNTGEQPDAAQSICERRRTRATLANCAAPRQRPQYRRMASSSSTAPHVASSGARLRRLCRWPDHRRRAATTGTHSALAGADLAVTVTVHDARSTGACCKAVSGSPTPTSTGCGMSTTWSRWCASPPDRWGPSTSSAARWRPRRRRSAGCAAGAPVEHPPAQPQQCRGALRPGQRVLRARARRDDGVLVRVLAARRHGAGASVARRISSGCAGCSTCTPGDRLLEMGSGWGGLAVYAAENTGCSVATVTLSENQRDYIKDLARNAASPSASRCCSPTTAT